LKARGLNKQFAMVKRIILFLIAFAACGFLYSQKIKKRVTIYPDSIPPVGIVKGLSDSALLDIVQRQTFRFFWHYAHPVSGLARERSTPVRADFYWDFINEAYDEPNFSKGTFGSEDCAIGGTGFGIMSTIVAVERGWIGRDTALKRLVKIIDFLNKADSYHGIFPHFMNGTTGKTVPFGILDDGADIVETSYLLMGFLCAREYFNKDTPLEKYFRNRVTQLWNVANWNWHTRNNNAMLYWHWSPENDFDMNFPIRGFNECLITYVMSASSPTHPIPPEVYFNGWVNSTTYINEILQTGILITWSRLPIIRLSTGNGVLKTQRSTKAIVINAGD
jgi:hypothetical protein